MAKEKETVRSDPPARSSGFGVNFDRLPQGTVVCEDNDVMFTDAHGVQKQKLGVDGRPLTKEDFIWVPGALLDQYESEDWTVVDASRPGIKVVGGGAKKDGMWKFRGLILHSRPREIAIELYRRGQKRIDDRSRAIAKSASNPLESFNSVTERGYIEVLSTTEGGDRPIVLR